MMDNDIPLPDFSDEMKESEVECPERSSTPPGLLSIHNNSCGSQQTITPTELAVILTDPEAAGYNRVVILDARFGYEFRGGRIIGAINVSSKAQLIGIYNRFKNQNVCVVIHCELSQNRGPTLYQLFREHDRHCNEYPALSYPKVFLLEGGYRRFYQEMPQFCIGGYIPMRDQRFVNSGDLRRSNSFFKKELLQQKKTIRTPTKLQRCSSQTCEHFPLLFDPSSSLLESGACDDESVSPFPLCASQGSY